jgi:uncharacterized protein YneF (UPF0154 family)
MFETVLTIGVALLVGFALGFKVHEVIVRSLLADYERLQRREARDLLRGAGGGR